MFTVTIIVHYEEILFLVHSFLLDLCDAAPIDVSLGRFCSRIWICKNFGYPSSNNIDKISSFDIMCHHARGHAKVWQSIFILENRVDSASCAVSHIFVFILVAIPARGGWAVIPGEPQKAVFSTNVLL